MSPNHVDLAAVRAAAAGLGDVAARTPVERSRVLSELVGSPVWLKCENLQRAGSFKVRGAYTRIARLTPEERARGVVAASAGNHAQGVAVAAGLLGVTATIYMPEAAALPKVAATREYGARVILGGDTVDDALVRAQEHAEREGSVLIHPFDHTDVVAGQGTVGLEILDQVPDVRSIVVPVGGGGLAAGIAAALEHRPDVELVGVQAASAAAWPGSLAAGQPVGRRPGSTMADGIAVGQPGRVPFALLHDRARVVTVSEEDLSRALLFVAERAKLLVEPSGAAGVAALLAGHEVPTPAVVVLSGGNVDPLVLLRVVRHGLAAAGRYVGIQVIVDDRPGSLATMLGLIAGVGGNVMHVGHVRTRLDLAIDEVEVDVTVETRGPAHCDEVIATLRGAGYRAVRT